MEWNTTVWDGTYGVGQEMSALAVIQSLMLDVPTEDAVTFTPPLTSSTGGNSTSNPSAGTGGNKPKFQPAVFTDKITAGDKAGAAILTIVVVTFVIGGSLWLVLFD